MTKTPNTNSKKSGLPSRTAAVNVLLDVLYKKQPLDDAWSKALTTPAVKKMDARDKAFMRHLVSTALRRLGQIDHAISEYVQKPLPDKARKAKAILQIATAECLFLKTPDHAVVNSAVDLAQQSTDTRPYKKLINAVLRRIASNTEAILEQPDSLKRNTPHWLLDSWTNAYGAAAVDQIIASHLSEPPTDLSFKYQDRIASYIEDLDAEHLPNGSLRRGAGGQIETWPGFADGQWWIQDAAATLPVHLLGDVAGEEVIDLCAAPGGKTLQLAAKGAKVISLDRSAHRLERLEENLNRLALKAEIVQADVATWQPDRQVPFVLLDAPCSATGTLRRHPDIAILKTPKDIASLSKAQARLLSAAAKMTAPGGTLVYCTCSLQPEEGPEQVERFLSDNKTWRRRPVVPSELPDLSDAITATGDVRTLPSYWSDRGGMDGFFIARLTAPC